MSMFELIKMLCDAKIDYVVVGGLAVALHGYQRLTIEHLLVMKTGTGRSKHQIDIEELRKVQAGD
ncbi:MAG: hypothetical protein WC073_08655 [Sterolibacterium sp.]